MSEDLVATWTGMELENLANANFSEMRLSGVVFQE